MASTAHGSPGASGLVFWRDAGAMVAADGPIPRRADGDWPLHRLLILLTSIIPQQ